jgi:hypothetical protein
LDDEQDTEKTLLTNMFPMKRREDALTGRPRRVTGERRMVHSTIQLSISFRVLSHHIATGRGPAPARTRERLFIARELPFVEKGSKWIALLK